MCRTPVGMHCSWLSAYRHDAHGLGQCVSLLQDGLHNVIAAILLRLRSHFKPGACSCVHDQVIWASHASASFLL